MAGSEEELKGLLRKVKEESEKPGLKLNIQKSKIIASSPITSWPTDGGKMEIVAAFIFFRVDLLDLLAVQGNLKSLLQHYSSKASILQHIS